MGNIIEFNEKSNKIDFDNFLNNDPYLKSTAINALKIAGYYLNKKEVVRFQHEHGLKETGKLSIDNMAVLITYFDPQTRQEIINHMNRKSHKNDKDISKNMPLLIITLSGILFFELYGIVSFFFDIIDIIRLINK